MPPGLRWRIPVSVLGPIAWLILTLLYVGFWASNLTVFQDVIVVLVSVLAMVAALSTAWIAWGLRYATAGN